MENKKEYTSPKHKLLSFFESSRDQWKIKTKKEKEKTQLLKNRIVFLEKSKFKYKNNYKTVEKELKIEKLENEKLRKEITALRMNSNEELKKKL